MDVARVKRIGWALYHEARVERIHFLAGSLAYNAFISLLPLFALLLYITAELGEPSLRQGLFVVGRTVFTEGIQDIFVREMRNASQSASLSVLWIAILLWGTLRIFRGLDTAFSQVYDTEMEDTLATRFLDGVVVMATFGLAILVAVVTREALPAGGVSDIVEPIALGVGLTVTLLPMYYIFPDTDLSVVEIIPGAVLAATGLTAFHIVFQTYLASAEQTIFGGILLLLSWLYTGGFVILVGVVFNAVISNRSGDVDIEPVVGGVPRSEVDEWTPQDLDDVLSELDQATSTRVKLTVALDERSVTLPPPDRVEVGADGNRGERDGDPGVTVLWNPGEPASGEVFSEESPQDGPEQATDLSGDDG